MLKRASRVYDKDEWRSQNVAFVSRVKQVAGQTLLDRDGKIQCRVMDLAGEEPSKVWAAYRPILRDASQLILFENHFTTFIRASHNLQKMRPEDQPELVFNDAFGVVSAINHDTLSLERGGILLGVLSFDLLSQARPNWWAIDGQRCFQMASRAVDRFGACVLLLNHSLDGTDGHKLALDRFEGHMETFRLLLDRYKKSGLKSTSGVRPVTRQDLLPDQKTVADAILNGNFEGSLGSVQIYRSRTWRMATIRTVLLRGGFLSQ